jgi:hypothetical protein
MALFGELEESAEQFDAMTDSFVDVAIAVEEAEADTAVSAADLFTEPFMQAHTEYPTIEAFVRNSPLGSSPASGDLRFSPGAVETYVAGSSEFESWGDMAEAAKMGWLEREIGLL